MSPVLDDAENASVLMDTTLVEVWTEPALERRVRSLERTAEFEALWTRDNLNRTEKAQILSEPNEALRIIKWSLYVATVELEEAWLSNDFKEIINKATEVESWKKKLATTTSE